MKPVCSQCTKRSIRGIFLFAKHLEAILTKQFCMDTGLKFTGFEASDFLGRGTAHYVQSLVV